MKCRFVGKNANLLFLALLSCCNFANATDSENSNDYKGFRELRATSLKLTLLQRTEIFIFLSAISTFTGGCLEFRNTLRRDFRK